MQRQRDDVSCGPVAFYNALLWVAPHKLEAREVTMRSLRQVLLRRAPSISAQRVDLSPFQTMWSHARKVFAADTSGLVRRASSWEECGKHLLHPSIRTCAVVLVLDEDKPGEPGEPGVGHYVLVTVDSTCQTVTIWNHAIITGQFAHMTGTLPKDGSVPWLWSKAKRWGGAILFAASPIARRSTRRRSSNRSDLGIVEM